MTADLFSQRAIDEPTKPAAPSPAPPRVRTSHPRFKVGDRVRPNAEWRDGKSPPIPSGEVMRVDSFGLGQVVKVGDDPRFYVSGIFEMDETDEAAA